MSEEQLSKLLLGVKEVVEIIKQDAVHARLRHENAHAMLLEEYVDRLGDLYRPNGVLRDRDTNQPKTSMTPDKMIRAWRGMISRGLRIRFVQELSPNTIETRCVIHEKDTVLGSGWDYDPMRAFDKAYHGNKE